MPLRFAIAAVALVAVVGVGATILIGSLAKNSPGSSGNQSRSTTSPQRRQGEPRHTSAQPSQGSSAGLALTRHQQSAFSLAVPAGWVQEENEVHKPHEVENTWHAAGSSEPSLLIDLHAPTHLSPQQDAEPVHSSLEADPDYRQVYYGPGDLRDRNAWMWVFQNAGSERIDYFFETCSNTVAVLGASIPSEFGKLRSTFRAVAESLSFNCE